MKPFKSNGGYQRISLNNKKYSVFYLSADLQIPEMFKSRKPLSAKATRAGWQGFTYDTRLVKDSIIRLK